MCNIGVLAARNRRLAAPGRLVQARFVGHDHQHPGDRLGGGLMVINFGLWKDPAIFGNFGGDLRDFTNPSLKLLTSGGNPISFLPDLPFFEATVLLILVVGIVYYVVAARGREDHVERIRRRAKPLDRLAQQRAVHLLLLRERNAFDRCDPVRRCPTAAPEADRQRLPLRQDATFRRRPSGPLRRARDGRPSP